MDTSSDKTMVSLNEPPEPKEPSKKRARSSRPSKVSISQKPAQESSDPDVSPVGCFGLLKKISCTLHCGGTTCSVKETATGGSAYESLSSTETSTEALPVIEKKRKRAVRTGSVRSSQSSEGPKKRARLSRAKSSVPVDNHVHSAH